MLSTIKVNYTAVYTDGVDDGGFGIHSRKETTLTIEHPEDMSLWDMREPVKELLKEKHAHEDDFCTACVDTIQLTQ